MMQADSEQGTRRRGQRCPGAAPILLALAAAAAFGLFFMLPYQVNGLGRFPLGEVAGGGHDPRYLWPFNQPVIGSGLMLGAYVTLAVGPLAAVIAAGWAGAGLWSEEAPREPRRLVLGVATFVLAALTWAWLLSPVGTALAGWILD